MLKRPVLLGLVLLLSWKTSLATPVFPLPALTAAPPQAASVAPPPAAAAPAIPPPGTPPPPPANPPKPPPPRGPVYSYLQAALFVAQPYGKEDVGHGEELDGSYALSQWAFFVGEFDRTSHRLFATRRYDVGLGINSADTWGHNFFAELLWTGASTQPVAAPGSTAHGYALEAGVRAVPMQDVELYAWLRHDENDDLPGHTSGRLGVFYDLFGNLALGVSLGEDAGENEYLLSLRWSY